MRGAVRAAAAARRCTGPPLITVVGAALRGTGPPLPPSSARRNMAGMGLVVQD
ncbi:MAG TPA: hypothetical protein VIJ00_11505 [Nakamurella sp.]